ncbi:MAG: DoxX family protein [Bergeyella sp.]
MNYFTSVKSTPFLKDFMLLVVRVFVGFAMLTHGYPKLETLLSGEEVQFYNFMGLGAQFSLILTVFAEFVCSIFLILGLFTRWASFFLAFTMIIAGLIVHCSDPFEKKELSLLYLCVYLLIFTLGPGKYSVDGMISKKKNSDW